MRRCNILVTWILILSIVNISLGAPTAVREGLEMAVDVDVAEDGTDTSNKRYEPRASDAWSTNAVRLPVPPVQPTPPSSTSSSENEETGDPNNPGSPESVNSKHPNYALTNSGSATGWHQGPSEDHFPNLLGLSLYPDTLPSTGLRLAPPRGLTGGYALPPQYHPGPSTDGFPNRPGWSVNHGAVWLPTGHQLMPQPLMGGALLPPLAYPELSEDYTNLADCQWSTNPGSLCSSGHTVTRPTPRPGPLPDKTLNELLKGRLRRRISGTCHGTVDSARSEGDA